MSTETPKVFICSTIYDFRDLRSALREWLEQFGYEVLASERTDFPQQPSENSYTSCLDAINQADYFLLFIGSRVGGWYDKANRISITRAEYQCAHERSQHGNLKLLTFVRQEVWDIKEDREALRRFLDDDESIQAELSNQQKRKVRYHPSKFVTNAQAIFEFIDEVRKASEMKDAQPGAGPPGNWVYQFASFKDVIDACRTVFNVSGGLRRKAIVANLKYELEYNLTVLLEKRHGRGQARSSRASEVKTAFSGRIEDRTEASGDGIRSLGAFARMALGLRSTLRTAAIHEAITSGELLEYDKASSQHEAGILQQGLVLLDEHINRLRAFDEEDVHEAADNLLKRPDYMARPQARFTVPNKVLTLPLKTYHCYENVVTLSRAIHHFLSGNEATLRSAKLLPNSPLVADMDNLESDGLSPEEARRWLSQDGQI